MRNPYKLATFVLAAALAIVIGNSAINGASAEPQPHMRNALGNLEQALGSLTKATADKGGHRVKAMDLTKQAIAEVKEGIAFDNKR